MLEETQMLKPATHLVLTGMLFLGASASAVFAQAAAPDAAPPPPPGMHGHHMMAQDPDKQLAHMTAKLNLTADQQAQIKPILQDRNTQMMALHSDTSLAGPDKMAKMKSINQENRAKIDAVLNDQQKKQWAELQAQQKEKMQQHMQEHGGGMGQDAPPPPPAQ
jgi:periplasmic protein CpxP/Spy